MSHLPGTIPAVRFWATNGQIGQTLWSCRAHRDVANRHLTEAAQPHSGKAQQTLL